MYATAFLVLVPPENSSRRKKPGESASATLQAVTRTRTDDAHEGVKTRLAPKWRMEYSGGTAAVADALAKPLSYKVDL